MAGRGVSQRGCGGISSATPVRLGAWDRMGWGRGWTPQHSTIPCGPTAVGRGHQCPHHPPQPDPRVSLLAHPIPQHPAGGQEGCLLPRLSSGTPGLRFQGAQLTSPTGSGPGQLSHPLHRARNLTPLPLPNPLRRAWQDLDPQGRHHSPG